MLKHPSLLLVVLPIVAPLVGSTSTSAQSFDGLYPTFSPDYSCSNQSLGLGLPCLTDGAAVSITVETSVSFAGWFNILNDIGWEFEPTDLAFSYHSPAVYSGTNPFGGQVDETDVIYQQANITPGFLGFTWCDNAWPTSPWPSPPRHCNQTYVAFLATTPGTDIVCHETGHAVGLQHGDRCNPPQNQQLFDLRCMRNFVAGDDFLGAYAVQQINAAY